MLSQSLHFWQCKWFLFWTCVHKLSTLTNQIKVLLSRQAKSYTHTEHSWEFETEYSYLLYLLSDGMSCGRRSAWFLQSSPSTWKCRQTTTKGRRPYQRDMPPCWFWLPPWESVYKPMNFNYAIMDTRLINYSRAECDSRLSNLKTEYSYLLYLLSDVCILECMQKFSSQQKPANQ